MASEERGTGGRAKLSVPRSADRARVPPVLLRTTKSVVMRSRPLGPCCSRNASQLQVNRSWLSGDIGIGSKGVRPRVRQTRRWLRLVPCPMQVLGVLVSGSDRAGRTGRRKASLGTTWLLRKGRRPALVDATLQITHLQVRPRADFIGRSFGDTICERLNDCFIFANHRP